MKTTRKPLSTLTLGRKNPVQKGNFATTTERTQMKQTKDLQYHMGNTVSSNSKTGKIFVSTSDERTCPDSCPLKFAMDSEGKVKLKKDGSPMIGACYAKTGPISWHWSAVNKGARGSDFDALLTRVKALKTNELWRHNQAGDLPGENEAIDYPKLKALVAANGASKGFTYTHKKQAVRTSKGLKALQDANSKGFTVNISADNDDEVDEFRALGLPVTVVIAEDSKGHTTAGGNKVKVCPAQLSDKINCKSCGLCALPHRPHVVGFRVHGMKKNLVQLG